MICAKCNAANADDARFCGGCGAAMSATFPSAPGSGPAEPPSLIGREIAGRYRILAKLGEGGMGAVYRAEQISLKRTVAVKLLRPEVASSPQLLRRFNAEAEAVAKLSHPNTVGIYDFGQDTDGTLYIAMEYIEGRSLRGVVHTEAPLHPARALAIAAQIAASLIDAHAHGLVHRDLKPDNVMLQDRGKQRDVVRVLDFGIAKLRDDSRQSQMAMTQAGDMLGTPQYMSPEQIRGEAIDGRTDVYALGCILYEMTTARLPFEAPTVMALLSKHLMENPLAPSQRRPDLHVPPAIDELVMWAMNKQITARPQTMEEYAERIAMVAASIPPDPNAPVPTTGARHPMMTPPVPTPVSVPPPQAGPGPAAFDSPVPPSAIPIPQSHPPHAAIPAMPPPPQTPYNPFPPQGHAPPPPVQAQTPAKKSTAWVWIVVGVLLAAGGGTLAYVLTRNKGTTVSPTKPDDPSTPAASGNDPWASADPNPSKAGIPGGVIPVVPPPVVDAAVAESDVDAEDEDTDDPTADPDIDIPDMGSAGDYLAAMAVPPGVDLRAPPDATKMNVSGMLTLTTKDSDVVITVSGGGAMLKDSFSSMPGAFSVTSHGKPRPGYLMQMNQGGKEITNAVLVFDGKGYSLMVNVMVQEKATAQDIATALDAILVLPDDPT